MHAVADCVKDFDKVFAKFREIIVDIAAMEIADMLVEFILISSLLFVP